MYDQIPTGPTGRSPDGKIAWVPIERLIERLEGPGRSGRPDILGICAFELGMSYGHRRAEPITLSAPAR